LEGDIEGRADAREATEIVEGESFEGRPIVPARGLDLGDDDGLEGKAPGSDGMGLVKRSFVRKGETPSFSRLGAFRWS
jgi:hypothetical protein